MAPGGLHPSPAGTPKQVADVFQQWVEEADVDGFNIGSATNPGSWVDVMDLLRPELAKRGLAWDECTLFLAPPSARFSSVSLICEIITTVLSGGQRRP